MSILAPEKPVMAGRLESYPYETDRFRQCWWEHLASKFDIPYKQQELLIYRKPVLKNLIKLREVRVAGWNNAWAQDLTLNRLRELQAIDQTTAWDCLRITYMESRESLQALDFLPETGFPYIIQDAPPQHGIDLSGGVEGWLQSLSHNGRKALKKKFRKAQEFNPELVAVRDASGIEPFFEELFAHHIAYWDEKVGGSYFNDPEERQFIVNWARELFENNQLVLDRLLMEDLTTNLSVGIIAGDTYYWLLTINTGAFSDAVPGMIGLYLRAQQAADAGLQCFNMGAGDYFYKVQSANMQERCRELVIFNPRSPKARLYHAWLSRRKAPPVQEPGAAED